MGSETETWQRFLMFLITIPRSRASVLGITILATQPQVLWLSCWYVATISCWTCVVSSLIDTLYLCLSVSESLFRTQKASTSLTELSLSWGQLERQGSLKVLSALKENRYIKVRRQDRGWLVEKR